MVSGFQRISRCRFLFIGKSFAGNGNVFAFADGHNRSYKPIASPRQRLDEARICG
jgi:hypothetical protein